MQTSSSIVETIPSPYPPNFLFKRLCDKALSGLVMARYPGISDENRYFVRNNYFARLYQYKFLVNDYLIKKPYKQIAYNGEFQQELTFVLPFAYWHYKNGTLKATFASMFTRDLYFFSPEHHEVFSTREWEHNANYHIPNVEHSYTFDFSKWHPVPFREHFSNQIFRYGKPVLVIANRYNTEWGVNPISYLDRDVLAFILQQAGDRYQVIYNRPEPHNIVGDNSVVQDLQEKQWLREEHPSVLLMEDLYTQYKDKGILNSFNHLQCMVYSQAEKFVSVHGGTATLASCFGGTNIIYSQKGREHEFREFESLMPRLSGAHIIHAAQPEQLYQAIKQTL
jgi:hypothetical protein